MASYDNMPNAELATALLVIRGLEEMADYEFMGFVAWKLQDNQGGPVTDYIELRMQQIMLHMEATATIEDTHATNVAQVMLDALLKTWKMFYECDDWSLYGVDDLADFFRELNSAIRLGSTYLNRPAPTDTSSESD